MDSDGYCFPGIARIAEQAALAQSTVKKHLKLIDGQWIVRGHRDRANGQSWRGRSYQACVPKEALKLERGPADGSPSDETWSGSRSKVVRETPEGGPAEYLKVVREPDTNRVVEQAIEQTTEPTSVGVADREEKNKQNAFQEDESDDQEVTHLVDLIFHELHLGQAMVLGQDMAEEEDHVRRWLARRNDPYRTELAIRGLASLRDQGEFGEWIGMREPCTFAAFFRRGRDNLFERCVSEGWKLDAAARLDASDRNGGSGSFVSVSDFVIGGSR